MASTASEESSGRASDPRIAERMHVQRKLVEATNGIRSHIGENVNLIRGSCKRSAQSVSLG